MEFQNTKSIVQLEIIKREINKLNINILDLWETRLTNNGESSVINTESCMEADIKLCGAYIKSLYE